MPTIRLTFLTLLTCVAVGLSALAQAPATEEEASKEETLQIEQRDQTYVVRYSPSLGSPTLTKNERLSSILCLAPAGGQLLDEKVAKWKPAGGFRSSLTDRVVFFAVVKDRSRQFLCFRFQEVDFDGTFIREGAILETALAIPDRPVIWLVREAEWNLNGTFLGERARLSAAIAVWDRTGDKFVRFLTPISTLEFSIPRATK